MRRAQKSGTPGGGARGAPRPSRASAEGLVVGRLRGALDGWTVACLASSLDLTLLCSPHTTGHGQPSRPLWTRSGLPLEPPPGPPGGLLPFFSLNKYRRTLYSASDLGLERWQEIRRRPWLGAALLGRGKRAGEECVGTDCQHRAGCFKPVRAPEASREPGSAAVPPHRLDGLVAGNPRYGARVAQSSKPGLRDAFGWSSLRPQHRLPGP